MAWAYRAGSYADSGASGAFNRTATLGAALSSGDRIVVLVVTDLNGSTPPTPVVSDATNAGNYTEDSFVAYSDGGTQVRVSIFSHANSAAATPVVTATSAGATGGIAVMAYSGLLLTDPGTDKTVAVAGTGGTAASGNTAATTAANELVVGGYGDDGWNISLTSASKDAASTFRGAHGSDGTSYEALLEDKDSGGTGAQSIGLASGVPGGSVTWGALAVVYKLAAGGGAAAVTYGRALTGVGR